MSRLRDGQLWIGGLKEYMDEDFIKTALKVMGEEPPLSVKVMTIKFSDETAGYGFINFANDQAAVTVMHKLNGKMMPNTNPPVRWRLNHSSNRLLPGEKNFSVWVGDLTPEVDDLQLYQFFSKRFQYLISAKVILDERGLSRGYGFIRFNNEVEQQTAMTSMNGMSGLGGKPIKVSVALNRIKEGMDRCGHEGRRVPNQVLNDVLGESLVNKSSDLDSWESRGNGQPAYDSATYWQQYQHFQQQLQQQHQQLQQQHQQLQQQYQQFQQLYQQWQQWQQQHPPPIAAAGQGAGGWNQSSYDASQEELPAPEMRKTEVVKVKKEKDHAPAISDVFAKSFVNNQNFNMEAVIEGHVEVKSEGDIDDTIKVDTKLNTLENKKAENVEKKHKGKNKFDLKDLKKNQKEKEKRKRKKEDEDIAERMKFPKRVVNSAPEGKEEESTDEPKPKKAKKKNSSGVN